MFKYEKTLRLLEKFPNMSGKKRRKVLTELLMDDDFIRWLFQPGDIPNLSEIVSDYYAIFAKPETLQSFVKIFDWEDPSEFGRSVATFLMSVANIALETADDLLKDMDRLYDDGKVSKSEYKDFTDRMEDYSGDIAKLIKWTRRIVKKDAVRLAKRSSLPKYITIAAYTTVPAPKYIDTFKIGYYLNSLFRTIYSEVSENEHFDRRVDWEEFFTEIFGENNLADVATFILLEGVHRIDEYRGSDDVMRCWDSLTTFALEELEKSPNALRDQMLELYIKRLGKMFSDKAFDLRVDLTHIDKTIYPKLAKSVLRYVDKISKIISNAISKK